MWTHVVVTWRHVPRTVFIYANGKEIDKKTYSPGDAFQGPTGKPYMIGNDGHRDNHQFYGSVMDLYVFGDAFLPDEINMLRGVQLITLSKFAYLVKTK